MLELILPLDFERLAEFRLLCDLLRSHSKSGTAMSEGISREATYIFTRLWVELGYLAQVTNEPGRLNRDGILLLESSLEPVYGDDCHPIKLLVEAKLLRAEPRPGNDGEDYYCERFAKSNAHLAGDYKPKEVRGNNSSAIVRAQKELAKIALGQQMQLLQPNGFKKKDGMPLSEQEVRQAFLIINTIDRCFKLPPRQAGQFSEGIVLDAYEVSVKMKWQTGTACPQEMLDFYFFLANSRDNPEIPKRAEEILAQFERYLKAVPPR